MVNNDYDHEVASRRLDAYIGMLKQAYGLDEYGMADLLGMPHQSWTKFRRAEFGKKSTNAILGLAHMTGIKLGWLMGESGDCEVAR